MKKNYKLKDWHIRLINNFSKYEAQKLTWKEIATEVDASWTACETFCRRNKNLFEKEHVTNEIETFMNDVDVFLAKKVVTEPVVKKPRILIWDIETSLLKTEATLFSIWQQNISIDELKGLGQYLLISWSAMWLDEDNVMSDVVTSKEILADDDLRIVKSLRDLLDEADIAVSHFGTAFDDKMLRARLFYHNIPLPSPYQTIDTCLTAKSAFKLPSYKLDYLGKSLGEGQKHKMTKSDWIECLKGDETALEKMRLYNCEDVELLKRIYMKLRPYIKHPNVGVYMDTTNYVCPACGSEHITWNGVKHTNMSSYNTFQCDDCGAHGRSRKSIISKEKRETITISIAK